VLFKPSLPNHLNLSTWLQNRCLLAPSTATDNPRVTAMAFSKNFDDYSILTMLSHRQQYPLIAPLDHCYTPIFKQEGHLDIPFGQSIQNASKC
jgi:hypothetical protein